MLVVKIKGGLGNQLFQYAFGKEIENKTGKIVYYDTTWFFTKNFRSTQRDFYLDIIDPELPCIIDHNIAVNKLLCKLFNLEHRKSFHQVIRDSDKYPSLVHDNIIFDGYWQNIDLFVPNYPDIQKKLLDAIYRVNGFNDLQKFNNSVGIHVRRGDYVSNKFASKHHALCDIDYYTSAYQRVCQIVGDVAPVFFSDDLPWCKAHLNFCNNAVFFENKKNPIIDMVAMSQCSHNIISNSTFSWWSSQINQSAGKVVVAPKRWFRTLPNPKIITKDIILL